MKKGCLRSLWALLVVVLAMLCMVTATAEKETMYQDPLKDGLFTGWYYVKDTVPDDLLFENWQKIYIAGDIYFERPEKIEIKVISGDQFLEEAVKYAHVDGTDYYNNKDRYYSSFEGDMTSEGDVYFYIDNDVLVKPGEAEFEIYIESATRQWTGTYYLKVLDYNEYPLLTVKQKDMIIDAEPGDTLSVEEIVSSFADFHGDELWDKINYNEQYIRKTYNPSGSIWNIHENQEWIWKVYDLKTRKEMHGITLEGQRWYNDYFSINEYGCYNLEYRTPQFGNVMLKAPITINAMGWSIASEGTVRPGGQIQYSVTGVTEGKTFVWSVNGAKAQIDKDSGLMTIDEDAEFGSKWTVTIKSNTGESLSKAVALDRLLEGETITVFDYPLNGILIPELSNWTVTQLFENGLVYSMRNSDNSAWCAVKLVAIGDTQYTALCSDADAAKILLEEIKLGDDLQNIENKWIEKDGYPVRLVTCDSDNRSTGFLLYIRNSIIASLQIWAKDKLVTMQDLESLAGYLQYDETQAFLKESDVDITVSSKGDPLAVTAGKNVQFTSAFANPDAVNKKNQNDAVVWSVAKADTGEAVEGVSIDAKGQLKVDKSLSAPVDLQVKVASELFGTSATYNISAIPVVSKVVLDPAQLFFYVGTEDPQTARASLEPASVPPVGLTWTPAKKDIVEITPVEDGVVSIKPLKAGKTDIAVKEPGGKNAKLTVNVVAPVESVELKVNGKPKAGGKVTVAATLAPKNVGNKAVQWSLDVGEDIATINEKGQLTIGKEVASGTKITVTCTALGAPTPVIATTVIEIP